jgi:hypothetical protein
MKSIKLIVSSCGLLISVLLLLIAGCKTLQMQAPSVSQKVTVDGDLQEWQGHLLYLEKQKIAIDFQHDQDHLYLALTTNDERLRRMIIMRGFNLWLESLSCRCGRLGLRYPVGMFKYMGSEMMGRRSGGFPSQQVFLQRFTMSLEEAEIRPNTEKKFQQISKFDLGSSGLLIACKMIEDGIVLEAGIPFVKNNEYYYGIGSEQPKIIKLVLEVPEIEMQMPGGPINPSLGATADQGGGSMGGGMGGGRRGGRGGGPGGAMAESPAPDGMGAGPGSAETFKLSIAVNIEK